MFASSVSMGWKSLTLAESEAERIYQNKNGMKLYIFGDMKHAEGA